MTTITTKGKSAVTVTLTPNEEAKTYFRVIGDLKIISGGYDHSTWQGYNGPFIYEVARNVNGRIEYYSVDTAGNVEATKVEVQ